jgi:hypothetical protein
VPHRQEAFFYQSLFYHMEKVLQKIREIYMEMQIGCFLVNIHTYNFIYLHMSSKSLVSLTPDLI